MVILAVIWPQPVCNRPFSQKYGSNDLQDNGPKMYETLFKRQKKQFYLFLHHSRLLCTLESDIHRQENHAFLVVEHVNKSDLSSLCAIPNIIKNLQSCPFYCQIVYTCRCILHFFTTNPKMRALKWPIVYFSEPYGP